MAKKNVATVFHMRNQLRQKFLEDLGWQEQDLNNFYRGLEAEEFQPESLFLDLIVNGFASTPEMMTATPTWWRERAPRNVAKQDWYQSALAYALSPVRPANEVLFVDFWERDLANDDLNEALSLHARLLRSGMKVNLVWLGWSPTLLENWQQEGMSSAADAEERLYEQLNALGFEPWVVPVTDPLGALVGARRLANSLGVESRMPLLMVPAFGNDRLIQANWYLKTKARFGQALGDRGETR